MDTIKIFVGTFCATAIMVGGVKLLLGGVLEESGKYILALIMVVVTVTAIANINISFKPMQNKAKKQTDDYSQNLIVWQAEYLIKNLLNDENINFEKIAIKTNKDEDSNIIINEVLVYGVEEKEKAQDIIISNKITQKVTFK